MTLPELAIRRHVTTLMIIVSLVVLGLVALTRLPIAFLPDVEQPFLFVNIPYDNASPEQVERMIVRPVEDALGSVNGLRHIWSGCDRSGGNVRLEFDWSTDMAVARTEVWEKIDRIRRDLPSDIGDIMVSTNWDNGGADAPIIEGRLSSNRDLSESYDLLDRKIVRPLERIPGVAQVRLDGVNPREVRINLRVADIESHGVDVRDINRALRGSNFDMSLGRVTEGQTRFSARVVGAFDSVEEIENLPIRSDGLRLRDIADVRYEEPPLEYGRHLDGKFAIGVTVSQEAKANAVEVCDAVGKRIEAMGQDPDLEGINFLLWFSQGKEIKKMLKDLTFTGIFGGLLAGVVLFGFLRRFGTTLVCAMCIPFSLIVTCGLIWAQGKTLNTLSLLGLIVGIGMLVDNAVVVMENIFRLREEGFDRRTASLQGAKEVSLAVVTATLASVVVFLPLIFNKPSEMNIYLRELGITVCLTLLASLFISQTLIPMATSWFIRAKPRPRGRIMTWVEDHYVRLLKFNLHHRWLTPIIGIGVVAGSIYPFMKIDKNLGGSEAELFVQVRYDISEDVSLEKKEELVTRVEKVLEPHREELRARSIYSFWSDEWSMTRVYPKEGETTPEVMAMIRRRLKEILPEIPGVKLEVQESGQGWRNDSGKQIWFQIVGEDSEVLASLADEAKLRLAAIQGLGDPQSSNQQGGQEIHVKLDPALTSRYGVSPSQPAEVVGLTYRGRRLQRFRTPEGEREMRLTLDEKQTESVAQLANLPIWTANGEKVPLASLAVLEEHAGAEHIQRDERMTSVWVGARYENGARDDYMPLITASMNGMQMPYGYSWTFGRWEQQQKERSQEFLVNLLLALLLVFAVMAALFESVRQAIGLLIALPFALAGAVWTLYLTHTDFDSPAAVGLLLLIGVVVNNGIVMIEHINGYRRRGMPRFDAMVKGGRERLRPILMTAITTLISLIPMAVQRPSLGDIYYYSMALVIMGGLFVSTFLTSILLPTTTTLVEDAYSLLRRTASPFGRRIRDGIRPRLRRPAMNSGK
jgi:HAE1 family hydrophobic/amphiphilic exporter-1